MRKVTTINLDNNAYQMDEEGYEALRAYLDRAARALVGNPDRDEILADLERAIADKCRLVLGPHKTVVSTAEIERILEQMGPVAGDEDAADTAGSARDADNAQAAPGVSGAPGWRARKLYRIREGMKWAGVCQGLAAYAGIDVTLVRIAVVLIAIFTMVFPTLLVYVVMCLIVPMAETPEEVAAAHGQPLRAQEVVDRVKKKRDDWRAGRRERRRMRRAWHTTQPAGPPPGAAARVTGGVLLPVLTVLSAVWFAAMATAAWVVWQGWHPMGLDEWAWGPWQQHGNLPRWVALGVIVAVYALLALPIGAARRASLYYANGGRAHGWADGWSGVLWMALVAVLLLGAWYLMPQLQDGMWHLRAPVRSISV